MAPIGPLGDEFLAGETDMVLEKEVEMRTGHRRRRSSVVGSTVGAVAAAVGSTRRTTAVAAVPKVAVAYVGSFCSRLAAVFTVVAVVAGSCSCLNTSASAVVAVVSGVHSCCKHVSAQIDAASTVVPAVAQRRRLRSRRSRGSVRRRLGRRSRSGRCSCP